ncbi:MAG: hypothetical protein K9N09_11510 [Candidatus Cloacimonetes bacterium]|nr:hypothetical protein [Candidatus Cloacimonadota bacterium]MCF7814894.1 hypothetical protein [Candidatus Cloacimonadota bacterium]MCF7869311.1 hypothetical protein [Candidatus Cloacimonadota bacterium]MCF7884609.1 hypothetical protein [Candidatus Cloacimonadota bacterium]
MKFFILIVLILSSAFLIAHPASDIELTFDQETSILTVNYVHEVKDADKHFVYEIIVYMNGDEIIEQKMETQDNSEGGSVLYKIIDAKAGDEIKVRTNCNKTGKKSAEIEI